MLQNHRIPTVRPLHAVVALLLVGAIALPAVAVAQTLTTSTPASLTATTAAPLTSLNVHSVDMATAPQATPGQLAAGAKVSIPYRTDMSAAQYAQSKANALHGTAPGGGGPGAQAPNANGAAVLNPSPETPGLVKNYDSLSDATQGSLSGFPGAQPSDQALACSGSYCLQAINSAVTVISSGGVVQTGFPKSAASFLGATCATGTPVPFDPDAAYTNGRFIVSYDLANQVDGCSPSSQLWVAISKTSNPLGAWWIYIFDTSAGNTDFLDFPHFGYNAKALYFTGNLFSLSTSSFVATEVLAGSMTTMFAGSAVTLHGFTSSAFGWQAVRMLDPAAALPYNGSELIVNTINGGPSGLDLWTFRNAVSGTPAMDGIALSTNAYSTPPAADNDSNNVAGCSACVESGDNRISFAPYYRAGHIYTNWNTSHASTSKNVPAIFFADIVPKLDDTGKQTASTSIAEQKVFFYNGDVGAWFAAEVPDAGGNITTVFNDSGPSAAPSVIVGGKRVTFSGSTYLHDGGLCGLCSTTPTIDSRWGDYSAAATDGTNSWLAGEYSGSLGDWGTRIIKDTYGSTNN